MALFLKAAAGILLTVILLAQLRQKELSVLLSMAVCAMALYRSRAQSSSP